MPFSGYFIKSGKEGLVRLYRPTGLVELQLVFESDMCAWPPRLPEQPIFYPVLNQAYARQIARDWNTKSTDFVGYVTTFEVEPAYISRFQPQIVGNRQHEELWIPAEQLAEFNQHIIGCIEVQEAYFGDDFKGYIPTKGAMQDKTAIAQFNLLASFLQNGLWMDFTLEIRVNKLAVFLHYLFWQQFDFSQQVIGIDRNERNKILKQIRDCWLACFPEIILPAANTNL